MIQSTLFFILGFLCAAFLALLVGPAVWRRAVNLTTKRIEASMPLTLNEITQIVDLLLGRVRDQLRAQQIELAVTQEAKEHIIKLGYDIAYGARPLRRVIQNMIEDVLAEHLLLGKYEPGTTIVVDKDPEAGLDIHAAETLTPVEAG